MPRRKITTKIEDNKVIFSQEVLEYYKNIRTEENSEWIDKYFEVLSDENNLSATKYHKHHIIPCCMFKDENCKNRKETLPLANTIEGNIIQLSVGNHMIAHYYLWKIIKNEDSRRAVYMAFNKININCLSENEIKELAKIQNECTKENMTNEEKREWYKKYRKEHKEELSKSSKERYEKHKERKIKYQEEHKKEKSQYDKYYYQKNKNKKSEYDKEYRKIHRLEKLEKEKKRYKLKREEILRKRKIQYEKNKEKIAKQNKEHAEERRKYSKEYKSQSCFDPIEKDYCNLGALCTRKRRHSEKYKDIIPQNCIIKDK